MAVHGLRGGLGFEVMRGGGIATCFAFDRHFAEQGFEVLPAG